MKVAVSNFQSLANTSIEAEGLTVIVGRSNLGKSALVRAVSAALFNRPGDSFVRLGTDTARVQLDDAPRLSRVTWEKGGGRNQFEVNGVLYDKVGSTAPPTLVTAGYRDVLIGKETIRPQVADQFDGLFLLDRSGGFVSDVLSLVSHLGVLLRADRSCGLDLKREKGLLGVRTEDLKREERKLDALRPIADLHARLQLLDADMQRAKALEARVTEVRRLLGRRPGLAALLANPLPDLVTHPMAEVEHWREQVANLAALIAERSAASQQVYRAQAAARSTKQEVEIAEAALVEARASMKICPVCDRPMGVANGVV